jgi:ATP-dependent helicase/nuclease subunit B
MLTLHSISGPFDSREAFSQFDPESQTWIVSDLKSKLDLNRRLLSGRGFVAGESVLRASELWKLLLGRLRPDLQVVSKEFITTLAANKMSRLENTSSLHWAQTPGAAVAVCDYMTQLMPILSHPDGEEMLHEWFEQNPLSRERWGHWFDLALTLWREFLREGFVSPTWASGVLVNELSLGEVWQRPLIVDLGAELDQVEADLLIHLSEFVDVKILRPEPSWGSEYRKALSAYEVFEKKLKVGKSSGRAAVSPPTRTYRKFTTMIAEVKDAVAQARLWLEREGVAADKIALVAPDIELYWPSLSCYLEAEGIPTQKDSVRKLHSFPDISRWLATLRLLTGSYEESDLEHSLFTPTLEFGHETAKPMTYERFQVLYSAVYGREDLGRDAVVARRFALEFSSADEPVRDDFVAWTLKHLPSYADLGRVEQVFKRLFAECPQSFRLPVSRWLKLITEICGRSEVKVRKGEPAGINCLSISSSESSPATHMIIFGLTEQALKAAAASTILFSDIASLADQFGFYLSSVENGSDEFAARWLIEDPSRELILSVPETDFAGSPLAPSWLWLRGARTQGESEKVYLPRATRWDELQLAGLERVATEKNWSQEHADSFQKSLSEDLGEAELENFAAQTVNKVSPSVIEDYLECPFIVAAKVLFKLSDKSELDLDVDPSRKGSLMHKIFELLTEEPRKFDYSDEELGALMEKAKEASDLELADPRVWQGLKSRYQDLARRFLQFEKSNRHLFPAGETIGREVVVEGFIHSSSAELVQSIKGDGLAEAQEYMQFRGRIDRVDRDDQRNLVIYDYKSSQTSTHNHKAWIKKNKIQLLLYAMAVEGGLAEFGSHPVQAALYYSARPLNRDRGFKTEDVPQNLYDVSNKRQQSRISPGARDELFAGARELVATALAGIRSGQFQPRPRDEARCHGTNGKPKCKWRSLCRAPHLNR